MVEARDDADARDPFRLVGTILERKYRVDRFVAEGGFGAVYAGQHLSLGRTIALKVLKPSLRGDREAWLELIGRFNEEASVLARLRHPNVVAVLDSGIARVDDDPIGLPWMALEWLDGETLRDHLAARRGRGGRTPAECLALLGPVLDAVGCAHDAGIVHRDVKASNLMLVPVGGEIQPRVLDFGIAKLFEPEPSSRPPSGDTATESHVRAFTAASAAPEQLSGARTGPWTDVYALALLVTEVLIDGPPVVIHDANEHYRAAFDVTRPTPARFGIDVGEWEPVLARALAVRPAERPRDARAFLRELEAALPGARHAARGASVVWSELPRGTTTPDGYAATEQHTARRARWASAALLAAGGAAVAVVAAMIVWGPRARAPAATAPAAPVTSAATSLPSSSLPLSAHDGRQLGTRVGFASVAFDHAGARVFYANDEGLWSAPIEGGGATRIALPPELERDLPGVHVDVFPDDARLLVGSVRARRVWIVPLDGKPPRAARDVERGLFFQIAPDGQQLAFERGNALFVGPVVEGGSASVASLGTAALAGFAWSPDSRHIAALLQAGDDLIQTWLVMAVVGEPSIQTIYKGAQPIDAVTWTALDRIAFTEHSDRTHSTLKEIALDPSGRPVGPPRALYAGLSTLIGGVAPRGDRFLIPAVESHTEVGVLRWGPGGDGLASHPLVRPTPRDTTETPVGWTRDGRVLVTSGEDEDVHVEARPVDGGAAEVLAAGGGKVAAAEGLPDGGTLVYRRADAGVALVRVTPGQPEHALLVLRGLRLANRWVPACVRCTPGADTCVASEQDGDKQVYFTFDPTTGERRPPFLRVETQILMDRCALTADGRTLVYFDRAIHVVDVATGHDDVRDVDAGAHVEIDQALPLPGGGYLLSGSDLVGSTTAIWHLSAGGALTVARPGADDQVSGLVLAPNGRDLSARVAAYSWRVLTLSP